MNVLKKKKKKPAAQVLLSKIISEYIVLSI